MVFPFVPGSVPIPFAGQIHMRPMGNMMMRKLPSPTTMVVAMLGGNTRTLIANGSSGAQRPPNFTDGTNNNRLRTLTPTP
jgi:hypothetical protein